MFGHKHQWQEESRLFGYLMVMKGENFFTEDPPQDRFLHPYETLITYKCIHPFCAQHKQVWLEGHIKDLTPIPEVFRKIEE